MSLYASVYEPYAREISRPVFWLTQAGPWSAKEAVAILLGIDPESMLFNDKAYRFARVRLFTGEEFSEKIFRNHALEEYLGQRGP